MVITTASLFTCSFDPEKLNLTTGLIDAKDAEFKPVPFVRFRKALATNFRRKGVASSFSQANSLNERTILIINSASLADCLNQITFKSSGLEVSENFHRLIL